MSWGDLYLLQIMKRLVMRVAEERAQDVGYKT
jgi:hypothetical protein